MIVVKDIRNTITSTTPVYAVVGVTDLAVEVLRDAGSRAAALRLDLDVSSLQSMVFERFEKVSEQTQQIPAQVRTQTVEVFGKAKETYSELAVRGEKLVDRIKNQKSTKDLFAQAGNTVSLGKGAVTTVRKAALDTQRAALVTLATGRREAGSVAASVQDDVRATGRSVNKGAAATLAAAEGTVTAAKKGTTAAERSTRSVAAAGRKAATTATTAAKTASPKVGS
jgi:hypothetical protein